MSLFARSLTNDGAHDAQIANAKQFRAELLLNRKLTPAVSVRVRVRVRAATPRRSLALASCRNARPCAAQVCRVSRPLSVFASLRAPTSSPTAGARNDANRRRAAAARQSKCHRASQVCLALRRASTFSHTRRHWPEPKSAPTPAFKNVVD